MTEATPAMVSIRIDLIDSDAMELWRTVARVATALGEDRRWCLVGGLMVSSFSIQAQQAQRATTDIDVLADARARPSATEWAARTLQSLGATVHAVDGLEHQRGFRFEIDGHIVDVLAPDGLSENGARTTGGLQTIQIPGGTQALVRTEVVELLIDTDAVRLRRPTLIAAILLKARALRVHARPEDQRYDLVTLLSFLDDPRVARDQVTAAELGWLRAVADTLDLDDPALQASFDPVALRAARAAFALLTA